MRGCLHKRKTKRGLKKGEFSWSIILPLGRGENGKPRQKWITFHGTRQQAEQKLNSLVGDIHRGEFVEPTKLTVGTYLDEWLATAVKSRRTLNTYELYARVISKHLRPAYGHLPLQGLNVLHVERYYAELRRAPATMLLHHAILSTALNAAVKKGLIHRNVARLAMNKPSMPSGGDVLNNVWTADEARQFLATVKQDGSAQIAALFALALDSGARKSELLGLQWRDLNGSQLRIERQLMRGERERPTFAPPKRGGVRSIDLSDETVALLREHKREQSELKIGNRPRYHDSGLVFAQTWEHASAAAGLGAAFTTLGLNRQLTKFCAAAKVRRITVHGLRHTCATLLLASGVAPHVVQRRLGHKKVEITLNLYAHVLPSMQADAASRLAAMLHG